MRFALTFWLNISVYTYRKYSLPHESIFRGMLFPAQHFPNLQALNLKTRQLDSSQWFRAHKVGPSNKGVHLNQQMIDEIRWRKRQKHGLFVSHPNPSPTSAFSTGKFKFTTTSTCSASIPRAIKSCGWCDFIWPAGFSSWALPWN